MKDTVKAFLEQHGSGCAATTITFWQYLRYQLLLAGMLVLACYDWKVCAASVLFALSAVYLLVISYKLLTVLTSCVFRPEVKVPRSQLLEIDDDQLPIYTVLIPMYKEPEIAAKVVHMMDTMDYPHEKLDVKLLLEEDDAETISKCEEAELPSCVETIIVPHSLPKTKPKACNYGLETARGKYLVIYDAEDRPDCDQLKKAVLAFRKTKKNVVCLQAKLNYYNPDQNILTKWFTLEYTTWFDLFLPGLHAMGVPIPLGGTSNHFKTKTLKKLGGWDPFNLTEDCDLGIRLHRYGYKTFTLDSTTWEEANSRLGNWIRQRSRWIKGYIQTHFVHTRSNLKALLRLGPFGFLSFLLTVGGLSFTMLLNPFFWAIALLYGGLWVGEGLELTPGPWQMRYSTTVADLPGSPLTLWSQLSWVFWGAAIVLCLANVLFVLINLLACARRGLWRLLPQALLTPIYWVLISIAAWKGFLQLFSRPFYWEKTLHGLTDMDEGVCHLDLGEGET